MTTSAMKRIKGEWVIEVTVPAAASETDRDRIFEAVADAAYDAEPVERDWDIFIVAHLAAQPEESS